MAEILFICKANVGRSQMAQGFYNSLSTGAISAGLKDYGYTYATPEVAEIMQEVGIDISNQKVTLVTQELIDSSKRVVLLCSEETELIRHNKDRIIIHPFKDPFFTSIDEMRQIRDAIKAYVLTLIDTAQVLDRGV